ncbi:EFG1 [Candida oxycetoniae]|uniref:rRNA-processing protein EFG1 n=1 Tax=Candida oxycetoniae TaxID=497107 RepID=A0AAI9SWN9_9ASCO|nr:EFG1 [Candida oxycetoniae]KAI3404129.1 EFG1 [Candida oxycetoniae]
MPKYAKGAGRAGGRARGSNGPIEVSKALSTGSSAKLKKKIRDIERALRKHDKLPADKKIEYERALKALNVELQNAQLHQKEKANASKYHMVRFFEKKKAIRKLKQLRKTYEEVEKTQVRKDIKKARKQLKHGEVDLMYVVLFPKSEKYISLYPSSNEEDMTDPKVKAGVRKTEAQRIEFRKEIENLMALGKIPFTVDDIIQGKHVKFEAENTHPSKEIDAPVPKDDKKEGGGGGEEEEENGDDFFE